MWMRRDANKRHLGKSRGRQSEGCGAMMEKDGEEGGTKILW